MNILPIFNFDRVVIGEYHADYRQARKLVKKVALFK